MRRLSWCGLAGRAMRPTARGCGGQASGGVAVQISAGRPAVRVWRRWLGRGASACEALLDAFGGEVAVQRSRQLGARESVWGAGERGVDLFGERVTGGLVEPRPRIGGVVPERERGGGECSGWIVVAPSSSA